MISESALMQEKRRRPGTVQWKKKIWTGFLPARRWEIREPSERCWYLPVPVPCAEPLFCVPGAVLASGAGMVKVVTEERNRTPLFCALPEAMADFWKEDEPLPEEALLQDLAWADAVVAGPGLSKSRTAKELLVFTVQHTEVPLVLDADALNLIAEDAEILSGCRAEKILTPHVGELARLLHMTIAECQRDPAGSAGRQPKNTRPAVYERIP